MNQKEIAPRLLNVKQLQSYLGLGANRAAELGEKAGARVKYGRRVLYDRIKLDDFINSGMNKEA